MSSSNEKLLAIGTVVIANDGFSTSLGQIADVETNRWGTFYVVLRNGHFEHVGTIGPADRLGIGWKVATAAEIERQRRLDALPSSPDDSDER